MSATIVPEVAARLAACLDVASSTGSCLPVPWHWAYFGSPVPGAALGVDGLAADEVVARGFEQRLWSGTRLRVARPLQLGMPAERTTTLLRSAPVPGSGGDRWFRRLGHRICQEGAVCIEEEDIVVYRHRSEAAASRPAPEEAWDWQQAISPDPVQLFRFSALTYNAHRIHYDAAYATGVEGHPGLVVNGHLTAALVCAAVQQRHEAPIRAFSCQARAPLYVDEPMTICGRREGGGESVSVLRADGAVAMAAHVEVHPEG